MGLACEDATGHTSCVCRNTAHRPLCPSTLARSHTPRTGSRMRHSHQCPAPEQPDQQFRGTRDSIGHHFQLLPGRRKVKAICPDKCSSPGYRQSRAHQSSTNRQSRAARCYRWSDGVQPACTNWRCLAAIEGHAASQDWSISVAPATRQPPSSMLQHPS